jgi:hypothetical protein
VAFTDRSDIFAAINEETFNRLVSQLAAQRPAMFNHATRAIAEDEEVRKRLCLPIEAHRGVLRKRQPLVTVADPLPVPGTSFGLNFAFQIADMRVDFHPGDEFPLPPELDPLPEQRLAVKARICGGISCPSERELEKLIPPPPPPEDGEKKETRSEEKPPKELTPLPLGELLCFCLDVYAVLGVRNAEFHGTPYLQPFLTGFEIVDIEPRGLENNIECYIALVLKLAILPKLTTPLGAAGLNLAKRAPGFFTSASIAIKPAPVSRALPNNPAIEKDQLRVFIDVEVV